MYRSFLASLLLVGTFAHAAPEPQQLVWDLTLDGKRVGTREATVTITPVGTATERNLVVRTFVDATIGPVRWTWKQRLTGFADRGPMAFQAVAEEDGAPTEVAARWSGDGWRISLADARGSRTFDAAAHRIDLSTADLLDPLSRVGLARFDTARVLLAETGEVWEGKVERLGPSTVKVGGKDVAVQGLAWTAPVGRVELWTDADGWLVRQRFQLGGREIEATLRQAPPPGPDAFEVEAAGDVVVEDL